MGKDLGEEPKEELNAITYEQVEEEEDAGVDDEGSANLGLMFGGCFRCGDLEHIGKDCTIYNKPSKGNCPTCLKAGVSLLNAEADCRGHSYMEIAALNDKAAKEGKFIGTRTPGKKNPPKPTGNA